MADLHPAFAQYIQESLQSDNERGYNYYVSHDAWYHYNLYHINIRYKSLAPEIQQYVDIAQLFGNPNDADDIFYMAELKSIIPYTLHAHLQKLDKNLIRYIRYTFKMDNDHTYAGFMNGDPHYWELIIYANQEFQKLSPITQQFVNLTQLFLHPENCKEIFLTVIVPPEIGQSVVDGNN